MGKDKIILYNKKTGGRFEVPLKDYQHFLDTGEYMTKEQYKEEYEEFKRQMNMDADERETQIYRNELQNKMRAIEEGVRFEQRGIEQKVKNLIKEIKSRPDKNKFSNTLARLKRILEEEV